MKKLKVVLDEYLAGFDYVRRLHLDPLEIPHRYRRGEDAEAAAFVAAMFAYGRVSLFKPMVERILKPMGDSPAGYLKKLRGSRRHDGFRDCSYRFSSSEDVVLFLKTLGEMLRRHGSLERAFLRHDDPRSLDVGEGITGFMAEMRGIAADLGQAEPGSGLLHLLPSPERGGAAKRACLFLRWVVRRGEVDLGIWSSVSAKRLVVPLDTHIGRLSRCLGFTSRRATGWATAREITESLRRLDPEDPLRYDFPLCHMGMAGSCPGGSADRVCDGCILAAFRSGAGF